jgi:hypothetical protein
MRELPGGATTLLLAIGAFSLGVDAGHQLVVLPLFAMLKAGRRQVDVAADGGRASVSLVLQRIGSAGISLAGAYYLCVALIGRT